VLSRDDAMPRRRSGPGHVGRHRPAHPDMDATDIKERSPHRFPLNDRAVAILEARRAAAGTGATPSALVFAAPRSGGVFGGWSNLKASLDGRLGETVAPWRLHDLRRTAATALGELGYDDALVDMLLNHTAAGTRSVLTRTYNRADRWEDRVRATAAWGRWIDTALGVPGLDGDGDGENVVDLATGRPLAA